MDVAVRCAQYTTEQSVNYKTRIHGMAIDADWDVLPPFFLSGNVSLRPHLLGPATKATRRIEMENVRRLSWLEK
jgi:hypothetical protein